MYVPRYGIGERVVLSLGSVTLELLRSRHFRGVGYLRQPVAETYRTFRSYTLYGTAVIGGGRRLRWRHLFDLDLGLGEWETLYELWRLQQNSGDPILLRDEVWGFDGRSVFQVWIPYPPLELAGGRPHPDSPMPCKRQVVVHCAFEAVDVGADS